MNRLVPRVAVHSFYECPCTQVTGIFYSRIVADSLSRKIELTEIAPGAEGVATAFHALRGSLETGQIFAPIPKLSRHYSQHQIDSIVAAINPDEPVQADTIAILTTSGSTGNPRGVELRASQLGALNNHVNSGAVIGIYVDAPARWICALPVTSIGGVNVLSRSIAAETVPVGLESVAGGATFDPHEFATAVSGIGDEPIFVSLVSTQLRRLMNSQEGTKALSRCTAILVGGGPTPTNDFLQAQDLELPLSYTYGMTETSGGCVFSGKNGPRTEIVCDSTDSRITVRGPSVAEGYRPTHTSKFISFNGEFRTEDYGSVDSLGHLEILGRLDDIVLVNGVNISRAAISRVIEKYTEIDSCYVLPNLTALVVADPAVFENTSASIRSQISRELGSVAIPVFRVVPTLPRLPNGKLDRVTITNLYG